MRSAPLARAARTPKGRRRLRGAAGTGQAGERRQASAGAQPADFLLVVWAGGSGASAGEGAAGRPAEPPPHGWGETPDRAPLRMEARPFQTITWRDIVQPMAAWLCARLGVTADRMARARIDG